MPLCLFGMSFRRVPVINLPSVPLLIGILLYSHFSIADDTAAYRKIVSVGGSLTEILFELGVDDLLVAVDTTSSYPKSAMEDYPNVGYMRTLSAEPILSLNPDLVLASSDAGPPEVLSQLREAGTRVEIIDEKPSIEGIYQKVRRVSALLNKQEKGEELIRSLEAGFAEAAEILYQVDTAPSVLFLLSVGTGAPMAAGQETSADTMISLAGGKNAMATLSGYKSVSPESIVVAAPEYVLIPQRVLDAFGSKKAVFALPELIATPAAANQNLLVFDGLYLMGFGPRTVDAVLDLATSLHPQLGEEK
ncbi:MAG: hemin ABC transporter substrate-binding protein [Pseudohongiellaceae bacterium]